MLLRGKLGMLKPSRARCRVLNMNLYVNHDRAFIPFRLRREAALQAGCTMGGVPPVGVTPVFVEAGTRYLATLGLETGLAVSLFSTFEYESRQSRFNFFQGTCRLHDQSNALVQFVLHQPANCRDDNSIFKNEIPMLGFVFGVPGTDPECASVEELGNPNIYMGHKIGGQPFFSQLDGDVVEVPTLLRNGYVHLLQIAFPTNQDTLINANWPFGESVFHVFAIKSNGVFEFRYIWA